MRAFTLLLFFGLQAWCLAFDETSIVAAGEWSQPVAGFQDKNRIRGAHHPTLRGRLLLAESPKNHRMALYLELQECGDSWGKGVEVYCDPGPGGGFHLIPHDASGKPLSPMIDGVNGGAPGAKWMNLPCDSTVRVRISPFSGFLPASASDYSLSGTFTVNPPEDHTGLDVFQGTLTLPPLTITKQKP